MCSCCCNCCCSASSLATSSRPQCQELPLKELTITVQPRNSSSNNLSSNLSLVERPNVIGSWGCDEDYDHYNADDFENRTPTMWRAWWLEGTGEPLPTPVLT